MLTISTDGFLKTTDDWPRNDKSINGKFKKNPLECRITLPGCGVPMDVKFKKYEPGTISWLHGEKPKLDLKNSYWKSLASMYLATVKCGVSLEMLTNISPVRGILRYHVALTFQLMMENEDLLIRDLSPLDVKIIESRKVKTHLTWNENTGGTDGSGSPYVKDGVLRVADGYVKYVRYHSKRNEYLKMVEKSSNGITKYGVGKITDSILTLVYCVLLAQGKTGFPIVGSSKDDVVGMIQLTQREFRSAHNKRVNSGFETQNIRDTKLALLLMENGKLTDVCKGVVKVPNNLLLYKMVTGVEGLVVKLVNRFEKKPIKIKPPKHMLEDKFTNKFYSGKKENLNGDEDLKENDEELDFKKKGMLVGVGLFFGFGLLIKRVTG